MLKLFFRKPLLVICVSLSPCAAAQISEYSDCSDYYHDQSDFQQPATQEEKAQRLEDTFYDRLSSITKCVDQQSATDGGGGGGSSGGASAGASSGSEAGQSLSSNLLNKGEKSHGITSSKSQIPVVETESFIGDEGQSLQNGREHIELEAVDNKAVLRAQIKAQADIETDPEIKEKLIEQYEALK